MASTIKGGATYTSDLTQGNSRLSQIVTVKTKSHEVLEGTMGNSLITMEWGKPKNDTNPEEELISVSP